MAERYLEIHWEHARPYKNDVILRQLRGQSDKDTAVMKEIKELRELLKNNPSEDLSDKPLGVVEEKIKNDEWGSKWQEARNTALRTIRASLRKNPVRLLQEQLPGNPEPFLYDLEKSSLKLLPGVAQSLTRFGRILRPLVEFRFAQEVIRINRMLNLPVDDVHSHLFGRERVMLPKKMRERLVRIQDGRCIYTGVRLSHGGESLDHVVPWSRAYLSQIENFVMTSPSVNRSKSDSLLAPSAMEKWFSHVQDRSADLEKCADDHGWMTDLKTVQRVAFHIYKAVDSSTGVWSSEDGVMPLGTSGKDQMLHLLRPMDKAVSESSVSDKS